MAEQQNTPPKVQASPAPAQQAQVQTAQNPPVVQPKAEPAKIEPRVSKDKRSEYVLIGRDHDGFDEDGNRKRFVTGDRVFLTKKQAEAFVGKFKPVGKSDENEEPANDPNK